MGMASSKHGGVFTYAEEWGLGSAKTKFYNSQYDLKKNYSKYPN